MVSACFWNLAELVKSELFWTEWISLESYYQLRRRFLGASWLHSQIRGGRYSKCLRYYIPKGTNTILLRECSTENSYESLSGVNEESGAGGELLNAAERWDAPLDIYGRHASRTTICFLRLPLTPVVQHWLKLVNFLYPWAVLPSKMSTQNQAYFFRIEFWLLLKIDPSTVWDKIRTRKMKFFLHAM